MDRRGRGRVDHDPGRYLGCGLEVGHRQEGIRGRLEPNEVCALGRRLRLVEFGEAHAPAFERAEEKSRAVVGALGERDRLAGLQQAEHERGDRAGARGEEQRLAALELAERPFRRNPGWVRVALVVEGGRLTALVRPDRRAVERLHGPTLVSLAGSSLTTVRACA